LTKTTNPNNALLVFLPKDDPEQFEANLAMAMDAAGRGKNVYLKQETATSPKQYVDR
jgi:hypothetical protein